MRSSSLLEFRCIVLNPSPDRRMVDRQTTLDQQFSDLAIRQGVSKIPANGTKDDLGGEVPPLEDRRPLGLSHDRSSIAVRLWRFLQHIHCLKYRANLVDGRFTNVGLMTKLDACDG